MGIDTRGRGGALGHYVCSLDPALDPASSGWILISNSISLSSSEQVEDGPNDEGEMYTRPGRLSDKLPNPYANEQVGSGCTWLEVR